MFQLTVILYLPAIAVIALLGWILRRSVLSLRTKYTVFVAISVALLTPVPTPAATLYAILIPSWMVFTSNDPAWYLQFWRFGAVTGIATAFLSWLLAPMIFGEIRRSVGVMSLYLRKLLVAAASTVAILILIYARDPAAQGPLLTTADAAYTDSCHNPLRDGRVRMSARVSMYLRISQDEWGELAEAFKSFADDRELDFRNSSEDRPGVVRTLYLSVCNDGVVASTSEQRWAARNYETPIPGGGVRIVVYTPRAAADWADFTRELIARLEVRWPTNLRFRDGNGHEIPRPPELE